MPPRRARTRLLIALTIAGAFACYLAGNGGASLIDRDEPRYAQCSREMLYGSPEHPGPDWVVPRHLGELRYAKPAGIYWLQAAAMRVFGDSDGAGVFAARFPSAVAMAVTLSLVALGTWRWAGPGRAAWTTFVLATSVMVTIAAKTCLTDGVLLLWITIAQACLYLIYRGRAGWGTFAVLGVAMGCAGLTKGPVVLGVMGMTLLALLALKGIDWWLAGRRARRDFGASSQDGPAAPSSVLDYRPNPPNLLDSASQRGTTTPSAPKVVLQLVLALLLMAAVVAPWLYLLNQREPSFLGTSVSHDVVKRIKTGLEGHSGPPGYHLATIWGTYLPWSILLPMSIVFAWKRRHLPPVRFALAAVLGPWVMFEAVQTKLPHYMLPVFPFLAFLTGDAIVRCLRGQHDDLRRKSFIPAVSAWAVILAGVAAAPLALAIWFGQGVGIALLLLALGVAYVATVVVLFARRRAVQGLVVMGIGMLLALSLVWTLFLPRSDPMRLSIRVADVLKREGATGPGSVLMLDYKEPSLAFYQGGTIREHNAMALSGALIESAPRWLVITRQVWDDPATSDDARAKLEVIESIEGLAYADEGRRTTVMVVRKKE
jgi:4-amino-4-deoxy-L-arabinose transferase-like glycosyltransferase